MEESTNKNIILTFLNFNCHSLIHSTLFSKMLSVNNNNYLNLKLLQLQHEKNYEILIAVQGLKILFNNSFIVSTTDSSPPLMIDCTMRMTTGWRKIVVTVVMVLVIQSTKSFPVNLRLNLLKQ